MIVIKTCTSKFGMVKEELIKLFLLVNEQCIITSKRFTPISVQFSYMRAIKCLLHIDFHCGQNNWSKSKIILYTLPVESKRDELSRV